MKVKIGDTVYDAEDEPIMLILTETDKKNIAKMLPETTKYCAYPEEFYNSDYISKWMK
jgi:hypothetical protein